MKSERVMRGRLMVGGEKACLSHARITIEGSGSYDEIAYRLSDRWEVVASHLTPEQGATIFEALEGLSVEYEADVRAAASASLGGE